MVFNIDEFHLFMIETKTIRFHEQPVEVCPGRKSYWNVDWDFVLGDVSRMERLTDFLFDFVRVHSLEPETFYGVPDNATRLALIAQYRWASMLPHYTNGSHALAMGRSSADGREKFLTPPRGRTIVLDDVAVTGDSLLREVSEIDMKDGDIDAAICLTDANLRRADGFCVEDIIPRYAGYFAMSNALELLPALYRVRRPSDAVARAVEEEFEQYGTDRLVLRRV